MGTQAAPWYSGSFDSKGGISCVTSACVNWPSASLHQIGATSHVPTDLAVDTALASNPDTNLLGPFSSTGANTEPL